MPEGVEELGPGFYELGTPEPAVRAGRTSSWALGPFDVGLVPIGAYFHPRSHSCTAVFMQAPTTPLRSFQDTRCQKAMAMHWGAFALTSEPVEDPPLKLKEALKIKGLAQTGLFDVCAVGGRVAKTVALFGQF